MKTIVKVCPKCGKEYNNERDTYCENCTENDGPVKLEVKSIDDESQEILLDKSSINETYNTIKSFSSLNKSSKTDKGSSLLGDNNAAMGDIKVESNEATSIGEIKINTEVVKKSATEELTDKKRSYRAECKKYCNDGFISDAGLNKLENYRCELDLDKDIADDILNEVKLLSKKIRTELPPAGRIKLEYAVDAIERNDERAIISAITDLEGWMNRVQVNELNQIYYQLYAIVYPSKYLDLLKKDKKEDYWKTYWAYVAYSALGLQAEAETALAELTAWDSFYPSQNQCLLSVIGYLMRNDENGARSAFLRLSTGYSYELKPIYDTLNELLETDWTNLTAHLSLSSKFYSQSLFVDFLKEIDKRQQEVTRIENDIKAKELENRAREKAEAEKIESQKESFILSYNESKGNVEKACKDAGILKSTLNKWLTQDFDFSNSYKEAQRIINDQNVRDIKESFLQSLSLVKGNDDKACGEVGISSTTLNDWLSQDVLFANSYSIIKRKIADEEETFHLKNTFIQIYDNNDCDLIKTCKESGVDSVTFRNWKSTDISFADNILFIEQEYNKRKKEYIRNRRIVKIKNSLPYIIILFLLVLAAYGGKTVIEKNREVKEKAAQEAAVKAKADADKAQKTAEEEKKKEEQKEVAEKMDNEQYAALYNEFAEVFNAIDMNDNAADFKKVLDAIVAKYNQIKEFESTHNSLSNIQSPAIRQKILDSLKVMKSDFNNRATTTTNVIESKEWATKIDYINTLVSTIL